MTELRCRTEDTSEGICTIRLLHSYRLLTVLYIVAVCDTEGRSHDSICRLPQETSERVQILHERRCDDPECSGGRVGPRIIVMTLYMCIYVHVHVKCVNECLNFEFGIIYRSNLQVCGTDGVSYENDCHRRTRSARARRDYMGDCDDSDDTDRTLTELCQRVRREQRCRWNSSNCDSLVRPREGCCPICGQFFTIIML